MGRKRKYPEVQGWWLYTIYIPSVNKYYVGVSGRKECSQRWNKSNYKGTVIEPYLDEWDSMIKTVIKDNLTKEQALKKEDELIQSLRLKDLCLNERRSGLILKNDRNAYKKQYYENNPEYRERVKQRVKQNRLKKKLEREQNQLTLFDIAS